MSTSGYLLRGKGSRYVSRADKLATFVRRLSRNPTSFNLLHTSGTVQASTWKALPINRYATDVLPGGKAAGVWSWLSGTRKPSRTTLLFYVHSANRKLHDNAPAHKAASVCQLLTPKNVRTLYHPPYSPDLSESDYFLFPNWKWS